MLLVFIQFCCSDYIKIKNKLIGPAKIKSIKISTYNLAVKFGELQKIGINNEVFYKYDINGNQIEEDDYLYNGDLYEKYITKYNEKGNKISGSVYGGDNSLTNKIIYNYNSTGSQMTESFITNWGATALVNEYFYNDEGKLIKELTDAPKRIDSFLYDNNNVLNEEDDYNDVGSLMKKTFYDDNGNVSSVNTYQYHAYADPIVNGAIVRHKRDWDYFDSETYEYNIYDNSGNWTKCTIYIKNNPVQSMERQIEYY